MPNINTELVRSRLRDIRTEKGLSQSEAGARIGLSGCQMQALETGQCPVTAQQVIGLSNLYEVQLYQITNAPLPYRTPDELLGAFHRAEISEGVLAHELHMDRLDARELYENYLERTGQER